MPSDPIEMRGESRPPRRIVAEVACNWPKAVGDDSATLALRFERVIAYNDQRGYQLESWQMMNAMTQPANCVETIVAVFKRRAG